MVKSRKQGPFLVNYQVAEGNVIYLLSAFKFVEERGWRYFNKQVAR